MHLPAACVILSLAVAQGAGSGIASGVVVDADSGDPIAGAVVSLHTPTGAPIGQQGRQVTDRRGRFVFIDVPASQAIAITASKPGFIAEDPAPGLGRVVSGRLVVGAGGWTGEIRLALSRLGSIGGAVVDEAGEPVVGVSVRLLALVRVAGREHVAGGPTVRTDDRGHYRAANLLPGRYLVAVPSVQTNAAPGGPETPIGPYPVPPPRVGGRAFAYPTAFHPGTAVAADAARVDLALGDHRGGVDVRLAPQPSVQVAGRVEGPAGSVAGLTLRLLAPGLEAAGAGLETATAPVGAGGAFRFAAVPAGRYIIEAPTAIGGLLFGLPPSTIGPRFSPPGVRASDSFADAATAGPPGTIFLETTWGGQRLAAGRLDVTVGDADVTDLLVRLSPLARIAGRVQFEFDPRTPAPDVLPAVHLRAEPADGSPSLGVPQAATSDDGRAQAFDLRVGAGRYVLRLAPGSGFQVRSVFHAGRDYTDSPFDAAATPAFDDVVVTVTNVPTRLTGVVRDAAGGALWRARVVVFPADRARWTDTGISPPRLGAVLSDNEGAFELSGLPDGEYLVVAVPYLPHADWRGTGFFERAAPHARQISVRWGRSTRQDLRLIEIGR